MERLRILTGSLRTLRRGLVLAAALALWGARLAAQSGGGFDLTWNRVGGGPAATAGGDGYEVRAAVGQPIAGARADSPGDLALTEGYGAIYAVHAFTLRLSRGWNVVSVPLQPLNPAWREVVPEAVRGPLWRWYGEGYEPALTVAPMHGYWIWSGAEAERVIEGVAAADPYRDLPAGWSLVGPAGLPPYPDLPLPLSVVPGDAVFGLPLQWNPALGLAWPTAAGLRAGSGAWVDLRQPAHVRLGP